MPTTRKDSSLINHHANNARDHWQSLLTGVWDQADSVEYRLKWAREQIDAANATAAILDPTGQKTAAEMEAEIDAAMKAAYLRSARHIWSKFGAEAANEPEFGVHYPLKNLRECLSKAGATLEDLDPDNYKSAGDVEAAIEARSKKIYRLSAQKHFKELDENEKFGWDKSSMEYKLGNLSTWLKKSGEGIDALIAPEDLPPALKDAAQPVLKKYAEERLDSMRRKTALLCARHKLKDLETSTSASDGTAEWYVTSLLEELKFSGREKKDIDPTGRSTAADIDARIEAGLRRCYRQTAEEEIRNYIDRPHREERAQVYFMDRIRKCLARAGTDMASLGMPEKYAPEIIERKFAVIEPKADTVRAMSALEDFEKCPVPGSIDEICEQKRRVIALFNKAAAQLSQAYPGDPDFRSKIDKRIDDAVDRAQNFYFSFNGKVRVYKQLRLKAPANA